MKQGWKSYRFDEVFDLQMGKTPSRSDSSYWGGTNIWVSIADMNEQKFISCTKESITDEGVIGSGIKVVPKDTVIMSFKLSIGKTCIAATQLYTNEAIMAFITKKEHTISPEFIYYYLRGYKWEGANKAVMGMTLNKKAISESVFSYPSLSEQEKIVSELDWLSDIIVKKRQQLKELDALAQSIFYEMFGNPVENEKGWEVKKLGEVGELARGVSKHRPRNAPELLGGNIPLIQTGDVANSGMYITCYNSTYSELGLSQSRLWPKGTLCITIAATIGKCSILTFDSCFPDSVVGYIVDTKWVNNEYIYYIFNRMQAILEENAPAVAQKNINLQVLNSLLLPIPPLPLQQTFAQKIEAIEQQKALIKQSIAEVETLFNARMQEYFE